MRASTLTSSLKLTRYASRPTKPTTATAKAAAAAADAQQTRLHSNTTTIIHCNPYPDTRILYAYVFVTCTLVIPFLTIQAEGKK